MEKNPFLKVSLGKLSLDQVLKNSWFQIFETIQNYLHI